MSDYFKSREKLVQGRDWRGSITVSIDDEEYEWTVRQLSDDEYFDVISDLDTSSIKEYREEIDEDAIEEYHELTDKDEDELSEDERERLRELRDEIEDSNILNEIDEDTFNALRRAGKYGVTPDEEDIDHVMGLAISEVESLFGVDVNRDAGFTRDDAYELVKEDMKRNLEQATDFVSFEVGLEVLNATMGTEEDEGN